MGGRPLVVGPLAVVAAVLLASLLAASPVCAQMQIPLFSDAKPKVVKKSPFRPTLPKRNPMRVTAGVSADTVAPPTAENSEVSAVVGTSSSASATVALVDARPGESDAVTPSSPEPQSSASDSSDTETSQSDEPAAPQDVAALSSDQDAAPAPEENAPADSANDLASDTTSGSTPDDAGNAGDDAAAKGDTAEADEASAPEAQEQGAADQAADEPAADAEEPELTVDAAPDEAELTVEAADEAPSAPAETAPVPAEDAAAEPAAGSDTSDETAEEAAPEPATATPADDEAPAAPAETEQASASADEAPATDTAAPAAAPSYNASVVLEVSPPPADAKETQTAALTPPDAPVPDTATPAEDETPSAAQAEPDSDAADSNDSAEAPDEGAEKPAAAEETKPSAEGAEPASAEPAAAEPAEVAPPPAHPIVAEIRARLADPSFDKHVNAADRKALEEFYGTLEGPPLWVTDAGFSDKAKAVIAEIGKADDWGLRASAFDLPPANDLLASSNALADDELQLSLAVLKYARYAQIGRLTPTQASPLFDQHPHLRNPKTVLAEIAAAPAPDTYLTSLHPQQEQFKRLHQALLKARAKAQASGGKPLNDRDVQLIVMNMERWRWMPRSLGAYHVWDNIPEYNTRVVKNGKTIYVEKTVVGQFKYATPLFSAPMRNIVFHPNWTVPPTIVNEDLAPKLQGSSGGGFFGTSKNAILARYGLKVSLKGEPIDADTVDWSNVNISRYTFTQDPGPANVLGKLKFNFPNRHAIYMHDTVQPEFFDETTRTLSHGCIRVQNPDRFAAVILGEDKGWSAGQVKSLLAKDDSTVVGLNRLIPVHLTYFTAVVDENGTVNKFGDIYGIDNRMAGKMFANPARFPVPATPAIADADSRQQDRSRQSAGGGLDSIISGLFGN